jgi:predicted amidophosphoribosyltransferase
MSLPTSAGKHWGHCNCVAPDLWKSKALCEACGKPIAGHYEPAIHYNDKHFHVSCALDKLPAPDNPQPASIYQYDWCSGAHP